ncbi:hypothetical protein HBI65_234510 [Parastagonospora nodorum]|nr:hypothetical protein HBI65_234510 [Parastagonospora nodorum]
MSHTTQTLASLVIESCKVTVDARGYTCDGRVSYACEVEFSSKCTFLQARRFICYLTSVISTRFSSKQYVKLLYISKIR